MSMEPGLVAILTGFAIPCVLATLWYLACALVAVFGGSETPASKHRAVTAGSWPDGYPAAAAASAAIELELKEKLQVAESWRRAADTSARTINALKAENERLQQLATDLRQHPPMVVRTGFSNRTAAVLGIAPVAPPAELHDQARESAASFKPDIIMLDRAGTKCGQHGVELECPECRAGEVFQTEASQRDNVQRAAGPNLYKALKSLMPHLLSELNVHDPWQAEIAAAEAAVAEAEK